VSLAHIWWFMLHHLQMQWQCIACVAAVLCPAVFRCTTTLQFPLAGMSASGWLAVLLTCWFLHSAKAAPTLRVNVTVLERSGQWVQVPELHGLLRLCSSSRWPKDT